MPDRAKAAKPPMLPGRFVARSLAIRGEAGIIVIRSACWITNPTPGVSRRRGEGVVRIAAYSDILPVMNSASRSILGKSGGCDAEDAGKNCKDVQRKPHGSLLFAS